MKKPNPLCYLKFKDKSSEVLKEVEMTEQQHNQDLFKFECGLKVLLTIADIRQCGKSRLSVEQLSKFEELEDYEEQVQFFIENKIPEMTSVKFQESNRIPNANQESARVQARLLLMQGRMPEDPYAGAHLNVTNIR